MNTPIYEVIPVNLNAPVVVEKISDIQTWQDDLKQLAKHDRNLEDQQHRSTRASKFENHDRLHHFEFTEKLQTVMDKLLVKHSLSDYPSAIPEFSHYADHFEYNKIHTAAEREEVEEAKRQRQYKKVVYLELEELLKADFNESITLRKANSKTRDRNQWLLFTIDNELAELFVCGVQESGKYLTILGLKADHTKFVKAEAKAKIEAKQTAEAEAKQKAIDKAQAAHDEAIQAAEEAKENLETKMAGNQ